MIKKYTFYKYVTLCTALLIFISTLHAKDKIILSAGMDYSQGNYGATSDTQIWYIPFSIKLVKPKIAYTLTIPYIKIIGSGNVIGADAVPSGTSNNSRSTASGLGDIMVTVTYNIQPYQVNRPLVDITAQIKIPTADKSRGLGSGEFDYYIQSDLFYRVNKINVFGTIGYKIYRTLPGINNQNAFYFSLGGSYPFSHKFSSGLIYDFREASTVSNITLSEFMLFIRKKLSHKKKLLGYFVKGLSDGSPDYGIGIRLSYSF